MPLMLYCKGAVPPDALTVIVPSACEQSLVEVPAKLLIIGADNVGMTQLMTTEVQFTLLALLTTML